MGGCRRREWGSEIQGGKCMRDSRAKFQRKLAAWAMTLCLGGCAADSQRASLTPPAAREVLPAALARKLPAAEIADQPDHWDADLPTVALNQQSRPGLNEPTRPAVSPISVEHSQRAAPAACRPVSKAPIRLAASSELEQKSAIDAPKPLDLPQEAQPATETVPPAPLVEDSAEGTPLDLSSVLVMAAGRNPQVAFAQERIREAWARHQAAEVLWLPSLGAGVNYYKHEGALQAVQGPVSNISRGGLYSGFGARDWGGQPGHSRPVRQVRFERCDPSAGNHRLADQCPLPRLGSDPQSSFIGHGNRLSEAVGGLPGKSHFAGDAGQCGAVGEAHQIFRGRRPRIASRRRPRCDRIDAPPERHRTGRRSVRVASARLAQQLSIDPTVVIFPTEPALIPMDLISGEQTPQELVSLGLKTRPELAESTALVQAATKELERVRQAPLLPSILLGMSYGGFGGGVGGTIANYADRFDFEATAYWQVRNLGFGEKSARNEARSQHQQAQIEQIRRLDQVAREVVEAQSQVQARHRQIDIARKGIETARDSHRRNLERIQDGQGLPIEVLQSLQALDIARREYLRTVVDYNESQFRLQWAIGWPVR